MKDIEDELPFAVPEGWAWCRLPNILISIFAGGDRPIICEKTQSDKCNIPIYSNGIENNGLYGFTNKPVVNVSSITISARGTIGFSCIRYEPFVPIVRLITIIPFTKYIDLVFLKIAFDTLFSFSEGSSIPQLTVPTIKQFLIPLPPIAEQKRIVTAIETIFTQIDILETNKANLQTAVKQAKSKILDLAIHGKLVPQDPADEPASVMLERLRAEKEAKIAAGEIKCRKNDSYIYKNSTDNCYYEKFDGKSDVCIDNEIPFDAPNGWMWCRLKNISSEILYGVNESARQSGSYRLLRITDIQNNYVNWEKVPFADYSENKVEQYLLRNNDIVFARTGATVGKSYLIENLNKAAIHASYLIRIRIFDNLNPKYIKYFFRSLTYWKQITDKTFGIGQPNVNGTSLGRVFISIPPITEQKRIVARIEEIFNALDDIQSNLV